MAVEVDVLMVTHRRSEYLERTLPRLLEQCTGRARVWLWQNGDDARTLEVLRAHASHPAIADLRHSRENVGLHDPINWLFSGASGHYLSKVDDDCCVADGWIDQLRRVHEGAPGVGVIGTWRFYPEDYVAELAERKLVEVAPGQWLLRNHWVQGSGFLLKRRCVDEQGLLRRREHLTRYFIRLGLRGWVNGFAYPFIREDHMDDPRSPHTALHTDCDLLTSMPLTAAEFGVTTLEGWERQLQRSARTVQEAPLDPKHYRGWRRGKARLARKARDLDPRVRRGVSDVPRGEAPP
jgi:glycosyltransferase involved in cell wall biosynthesis